MGTYYYYRLTLSTEKKNQDIVAILGEFRETCAEAKAALNEDGRPLSESNWKSVKADLKRFSRSHRGIFFELACRPCVVDGNEEQPWAIVYLNGAIADSFTVEGSYIDQGPRQEEAKKSIATVEPVRPVYASPVREKLPKNGTVIYLWSKALGVPQDIKEAAAMAQCFVGWESPNDAVAKFLKDTYERSTEISDQSTSRFYSLCEERPRSVSLQDLKDLSHYFATLIPETIDTGAVRLTLDCPNWDILLDHIMASTINHGYYTTIGRPRERKDVGIILYAASPKVCIVADVSNSTIMPEKEYYKWVYRGDVVTADSLPKSKSDVCEIFGTKIREMLCGYHPFSFGVREKYYDAKFTASNGKSEFCISFRISASRLRSRHYMVSMCLKWSHPCFEQAAYAQKRYGLIDTTMLIRSYYDGVSIGDGFSTTINTYSDVDAFVLHFERIIMPLLKNPITINTLDAILNGDLFPQLKKYGGDDKSLVVARLSGNPDFEMMASAYEAEERGNKNDRLQLLAYVRQLTPSQA